MPIEVVDNEVRLGWRIGLWFASLLLAVTGLALVYSLPQFGNPGNWEDSFSVVFRVAMIFALPVACLYLPAVVALGDAVKRRLRVLLVSGALIGPVCIALLGIVAVLTGRESAHDAWYGDPLTGMGTPVCMFFALIVGSATTIFYAASLRIIVWRTRLAAANDSSVS
jgi:hypothetical protein